MFSSEFEQKYGILEVLGEGGMGRVYLAEEKSLQRKVAIKFLTATAEADALAVDRFHQEAKICAALKHPNIVPVFATGTESGYPYMVFEFVEGADLAHAIVDGPMPHAEALRIVRGVLSGLECAHGQGIIHRDLKPQNILIRKGDNQPMIADFGMAKREEGSDVRTKRGLIVGTPLYMAPEQIRGKTLTPGVDLYAMGCTLYEMLTGTPPFMHDNEVAILEMHLNRPPPKAREAVPTLPPAIDDLLGVALEKAPQDRFRSAKEFGDAIDALLENRPMRLARSLSRPGLTSKAGITRAGSRPDQVRVSSSARSGRSMSSRSRPDQGPVDVPNPAARLALGGSIFVIGLIAAWLFYPGSAPVAKDVRVVLESDGTASAEWGAATQVPGLLLCVPEDGGPLVRAPAVRNQAGLLEARATGLTVGRAYKVELRHGKHPVWAGTAAAPQPRSVPVKYPAPDRAELELPPDVPEQARIVRAAGKIAPDAERTGRAVSFKLAPGEAYDDLAVEWPLAPGLAGRAKLPAVEGLAHRLAAALERHDSKAHLVRLVTRRDYRVEAEDDQDPSRPRDEFFDHQPLASAKRPGYLQVVREALAGEAWLADLEAFRPLAAEFFSGAGDDQDAVRARLYEALLTAEYYDLVIRSQRKPPELGIREVYRAYVDHAYHKAAHQPDPALTVLHKGVSGWGTADRAQWDVFLAFWRESGSDAIIPDSKHLTEERARALIRPERIEAWDGVPADRRGDTVQLTLTSMGLRPIYFYDVTFRSATGDPDAGKPFHVHITYPPEGMGYMAYMKPESERPAPGRADVRNYNWTEFSARFPARLLPKGKLAVRLSYEHLPGPTLKQLGIWHRTAFIREMAVRLEAK